MVLKQTEISAAITPSEVGASIWYGIGFWTQSRGFGSAKHCDCVEDPLSIYAKSPMVYSNLDMDVPGRMVGIHRGTFLGRGLTFISNPSGEACSRPSGNSIGKAVVVKMPNGDGRLGPDTQIPPYSMRTGIMEEYEWKAIDQAYRIHCIRGKMLLSGAHCDRINADGSDDGDVGDIPMGITPSFILRANQKRSRRKFPGKGE